MPCLPVPPAAGTYQRDCPLSGATSRDASRQPAIGHKEGARCQGTRSVLTCLRISTPPRKRAECPRLNISTQLRTSAGRRRFSSAYSSRGRTRRTRASRGNFGLSSPGSSRICAISRWSTCACAPNWRQPTGFLPHRRSFEYLPCPPAVSWANWRAETVWPCWACAPAVPTRPTPEVR